MKEIKKPSVIVVGAGVAGLKASLDMALSGCKVILIEAKPNCGGRINTVYASDRHTPIELGASYWEGDYHCFFYQQYFSNDDGLTHAQTIRLDETKSTLISIDNGNIQSNLLYYYHQAKKLLDGAETIGIGKTFQEYVEAIDLSKYREEDKYWIKRFLENSLQHHCTPLALGGFPSFNREIRDINEAWNDEDADFCFVKNGYHNVVHQLMKECQAAGVRILLDTPVVKIADLQNYGVKIYTSGEVYQADKVVSTIPIGVLKTKAKSLFEPALSKNKLRAIDSIGVHDATRVILEFDTQPFWDNIDGPYLYLDSISLDCLLEFRNAYPLCGKTILLTGKYSDVARKLYLQYPQNSIRAEDELITRIMSDLRKAFPYKDIPDPIKTWVYCWTHDAYAQGAYPYRTPIIDEFLQQALEQPEGNVYFAGADFSRFGFSVHHAYNNGQKIAKALIESA